MALSNTLAYCKTARSPIRGFSVRQTTGLLTRAANTLTYYNAATIVKCFIVQAPNYIFGECKSIDNKLFTVVINAVR
jgi:hypothetical protein